MVPTSFMLPWVLGCLSTAFLAGVRETLTTGVIDVQVTGDLVVNGQKDEGEEAWKVTGYVRAEGHDLLLDCSDNPAARKILKAELGNPDAWTSTAVPVRIVKVKGRLKFRPSMKDDSAKRVERTDSVPVIVVDSLMVVE